MSHIPKDELLSIIADDLRYLADEWNEKIDDHSLRRGSVVLRRLLVEGELQRSWKAAGFAGEPMVKCSSLSVLLRRVDPKRITFASAGGAHCNGAIIQGSLMVNYAMTLEELQKMGPETGLPEEIVGLRALRDAPCLIIDRVTIVRRDVIKYVANKLGGAHYDRKRGDEGAERAYKVLDRVGKEWVIADKSAVYFELLSAGQALAKADDIRKLRNRIRELRG